MSKRRAESFKAFPTEAVSLILSESYMLLNNGVTSRGGAVWRTALPNWQVSRRNGKIDGLPKCQDWWIWGRTDRRESGNIWQGPGWGRPVPLGPTDIFGSFDNENRLGTDR